MVHLDRFPGMTSVSPKVKFRSKKPERHISVSEETCLTIAAYNFSPLIVLYLQKTSAMLISAWTKVICALSAKKEKHQCDQKSFGTHIPSRLGKLRADGRVVYLPPQALHLCHLCCCFSTSPTTGNSKCEPLKNLLIFPCSWNLYSKRLCLCLVT